MSSQRHPQGKPLPPLPLIVISPAPSTPLPPVPFPRPDSLTIPPAGQHAQAQAHPQRSLDTFSFANFHHIQYHPARGDEPPKIQYWLRADVILAGFPGAQHVPEGHWPMLVRLASEAYGGLPPPKDRDDDDAKVKEIKLITAWYVPEEAKVSETEATESEVTTESETTEGEVTKSEATETEATETEVTETGVTKSAATQTEESSSDA